MEHNFNKYEDDFITDLNTPYDYESIMHYRPLSFNKNASVPTITTTIPYFNEIIGQRLDFSAVDIVRLNRMYDCGGYARSYLFLCVAVPFLQEDISQDGLFQPTHTPCWTSAHLS